VVKDPANESYQMIADIVIAVAWNITGCGLLYIVMGAFCLQYALVRLRKDYQARLEVAKERHNHETNDGGYEKIEVEYQDSAQQAAIDAAQSAFADTEVDIESPKEKEQDGSESATKTSKEEDESSEPSWIKSGSKENDEIDSEPAWVDQTSKEENRGDDCFEETPSKVENSVAPSVNKDEVETESWVKAVSTEDEEASKMASDASVEVSSVVVDLDKQIQANEDGSVASKSVSSQKVSVASKFVSARKKATESVNEDGSVASKSVCSRKG
jgi:hypothetical protein